MFSQDKGEDEMRGSQYGVGSFITDEQKKKLGQSSSIANADNMSVGPGIYATYGAGTEAPERHNPEAMWGEKQWVEHESERPQSAASVPALPVTAKKVEAEKPEVISSGGMTMTMQREGDDRVYRSGTEGQPGYGYMRVHGGTGSNATASGQNPAARGVPSRQQLAAYGGNQPVGSLAQLGARDLGNGQMAVGQTMYSNPGYTFKGEGAEKFFQHVPHGGGYNPYRQTFQGPSPRERYSEWLNKGKGQTQRDDEPMGWIRKKERDANESRERIAAMSAAQSMNTAMMQDARAREQGALGVMQFMDNQQTNALNRQMTAQQIAQARNLENARKILATADKNSEQYKRAQQYIAAQSATGQQETPELKTIKLNGEDTTVLMSPDGTYSNPLSQEQSNALKGLEELAAGDQEQLAAIHARSPEEWPKLYYELLRQNKEFARTGKRPT
jgi:hypothetical protein